MAKNCVQNVKSFNGLVKSDKMKCERDFVQKMIQNEQKSGNDADRINCDCYIQCIFVLINQYDETTCKNIKNISINTTHKLNEKLHTKKRQAKKLFEQTCQVDQDHLYGPNRIIEIQCSWNV